MSRIEAYFHCKTCLQSGQKDKISVGLRDPGTLIIHCDNCDQEMGKFTLANPLAMGECATCGKPLGPGHVH